MAARSAKLAASGAAVASAGPRIARDGYVEAAAPFPHARGWLLLGWTTCPWAESAPAGQVHALLTVGSVTGQADTCFYPRTDVPPGATGFVCVLAGPCPPGARLTGLEVPHTGTQAGGLRIPAIAPDRAADALELGVTCRRAIRAALGDAGHPVLSLLPRPAYDGADGVAALWPPVHFELDQAIWVPPAGLALTGWFLDSGATVQALRIRDGSDAVATLDPDRWVGIRRPDVLEALGPRYGLESDEVGFFAFAPGVAAPGGASYLEVETRGGAIAYKPIRPLDRADLGTIKQFLSVPRPPQGAMQAAFDEVIGPVVAGLNRARLARPRRTAEIAYGQQPDAPATSLVVPLYGRLDFMEYQLALFSERPDPGTEIIYVLDDPKLRDEAERLAGSCWARFRLPFRLLVLAENLGFAPANNVGLRAARGRLACLLNSDVFPVGSDGMSWLPALAAELERDPSIGVIGPLLVYEDGTVQHQGMHFERVPGLPDWAFPIHTGKGRPAPEPATVAGRAGLLDVPAVTGACMVLRRDELLAGGGLDETYLIGDFEDSDLCQRLRAAGKRCVVDPRRRLYHLERQSQGEAQPWRMNATFYNAWQHQQRWPTHALVEA